MKKIIMLALTVVFVAGIGAGCFEFKNNIGPEPIDEHWKIEGSNCADCHAETPNETR